jgi:3-oxoacyl-[acyl-carrier-protein] synthase III
MAKQLPRLTGFGFSVPANIRTNNDPIFDYLKAHGGGAGLFQGYEQRRILVPGETLMTMMLPAAQNALSDAGLFASDIDLLIGMGSISPYATPNELCLLHKLLGLPESCPVVPLNREFSGFNWGVLAADALIRVGKAKNVLVVVGTNWTRHVSYETPQSISAGDGAGAAVVSLSSDGSRWTLLDDFSITQTGFYGTMFMQGDPVDAIPPQTGPLFTDSFFHITQAGIETYKQFGIVTAPSAISQVLERNGLTGADVAMTAHQSSSVLLDAWVKMIQPAQLLSTITIFANMTGATIPVNLAWAPANDPVTPNFLVCLALGPEAHADAMLLKRDPVE